MTVRTYQVARIDVIYYYVIQTDNGSVLHEANTRRQEGKCPMIKVFCSVASLSYRYIQSIQCSSFTGQTICNPPYFYHSSPLPPYYHVGFNLSHPLVPCYISNTLYVTSVVARGYLFFICTRGEDSCDSLKTCWNIHSVAIKFQDWSSEKNDGW